MLARLELEQIEQVWMVAPEAALAEEWENNGCCAESLQPIQPVEEQRSMSVQPEEWWPEQCVP